jgi:hypothetical protein
MARFCLRFKSVETGFLSAAESQKSEFAAGTNMAASLRTAAIVFEHDRFAMWKLARLCGRPDAPTPNKCRKASVRRWC